MVKYCQECGNPSYDGATICGNCGAKFPPKSAENSKPPIFEEDKKGGNEIKTDFNFSKTLGGFKNLSKKLKDEQIKKDKEEPKSSKIQIIENSEFKDLSKKINLHSSEKDEKEAETPSYSGSVIGFKEKDKGIKDPARKFKPIISSTEKSKAEKQKEVKTKAPEDDGKRNKKSLDLPNTSSISFNFNKKNIILIAIVAIILAAIIGASIASMTPSNNETLYYTDGTISFYYPGNWSMYNNTDGSNGDIAFKTPDKLLIGYTTISGGEITFDLINAEINQTAASLGGSIIQYKDITINGLPATDVIISSADHGYSRYISIINNGVYYSFVINNGKTSDVENMDSLNSPDVQKMINSIKFSNLAQVEQTNQDY